MITRNDIGGIGMDSGILTIVIVFSVIFTIVIIAISVYGSIKQSNANNDIITAGQSIRIGMEKDEVLRLAEDKEIVGVFQGRQGIPLFGTQFRLKGKTADE